MALDSTKVSALHALARSGTAAIACAQVLEVTWSASVTRYYAWTNYGELSPFQNIPYGPIETRLLGNPFNEFDVNPDLRTERIPLVFDDIDGEMTRLFNRYGTVRCILHYYWPQVDLDAEVWHGMLQKPAIFGVKQVSTEATNGYWSREKSIPHSMRPPDYCRFNHFGGELPTAEMVRTNGCPYDVHVGGSLGLLNGSVPFVHCPKDVTACTARFGHSRFFGGYSTDASATVSDQNTGFLAISKGNNSSNIRPIPWLYGSKHLRGLNLLMYRREPNQNDPDRGWFAGVWEVSDTRISAIRNIRINEKHIEQIHLDVRYGHRGQPAVANYNAGGQISNFSGVSHFSARYGWTNPINLTPQSITSECDADGCAEVAVYNSTGAGNGLIGEYFGDTTWTSSIAERVDHQINFPNPQYDPPIIGLPQVGWSARWTATITFPFTETYTITATIDDAIKLWIDGNVILDQLVGPPGTYSGTFAATANTPYTFQCDFIQGNAPGIHPWYIIVEWSSPSTPQTPIPNSAFTHPGSTGFVRQWSNDRVWGILELYTNQAVGMGYDANEINTTDFRTASTWGLKTVTFTLTTPDGETRTFTRRRTTLDALYEGRSAVEQIVDTCRAGALSVPFQHEGKLTIRPFRAFTSAELAAAPIFTDKITNQTGLKRRIVHDGDGPAIQISVIPDDVLPNEITMQFEDSENLDIARPITVDDPNQKRKAGKKLGLNTLETIPKRFAAFGVRFLAEAVRLAYRTLWFGEFDEGGTKNNCRVVFQTPYEFAVDLVRYGPIRIDSALLDVHGYGDPFAADQTPPSTPEGYGAEFVDETEITLTIGTSDDVDAPEIVPFEYFRVLSLRRVANGRMEITAQAYNVTEYANFEVDAAPTGVIDPPDPGGPGGDNGDIGPGGDIYGDPCILNFASPYYDKDAQAFVIPVNPC